MSAEAPWALVRRGERARFASVIRTTVEALRRVAWLLEPIIPEACGRLRRALGDGAVARCAGTGRVTWLSLEPGTPLGAVPPLFPKLRERAA